MKKSLVSDTALPNKVIQYLLAKSRVVSVQLSGLHAVFKEEMCVEWVQTPRETIEAALRFSGPRTSAADLKKRRDKLKLLFGSNTLDKFIFSLSKLVDKP
jgi:hypothetical protein